MAAARRIGRVAGTVDAIVVGAGHSGLAMSRALAAAGVEHVHEEYEGGHFGTSYRYEASLSWLVPRLSASAPGPAEP